MECQNRVKLAFKIRGDLIKALERKKKKTIQVIKIIKSDSNEPKSLSDGSVVHEELVEITELEEEYNSETEQLEEYDEKEIYIGKDEIHDGKIVSEEIVYLNEPESITDDVITDATNAEPLDAVSFLLEKKDLFKTNKEGIKTNSRRSHKCEVCDKTFMRKSNLVDHLRLHANVRLVQFEFDITSTAF